MKAPTHVWTHTHGNTENKQQALVAFLSTKLGHNILWHWLMQNMAGNNGLHYINICSSVAPDSLGAVSFCLLLLCKISAGNTQIYTQIYTHHTVGVVSLWWMVEQWSWLRPIHQALISTSACSWRRSPFLLFLCLLCLFFLEILCWTAFVSPSFTKRCNYTTPHSSSSLLFVLFPRLALLGGKESSKTKVLCKSSHINSLIYHNIGIFDPEHSDDQMLHKRGAKTKREKGAVVVQTSIVKLPL